MSVHNDHLSQIMTILAHLAPLTDVTDLCHLTCDDLSTHLGYRQVAIYLLDDQNQTLYLTAATPNAHLARTLHLEDEVLLPIQALRHSAPVMAGEELAVPLRSGIHLQGVIQLWAETPLTTQDEQAVSIIAQQVATALQHLETMDLVVAEAERMRYSVAYNGELLSRLSHDLRTPLNSIIGFSDVILDGLDGEINLLVQEDVSAIRSSGYMLLNRLNNMLDMVRLEAGQLHMRSELVPLPALFEEVLNDMRRLIEDTPLALRADIQRPLPVIRGDASRLKLIFNNLVTYFTRLSTPGTLIVTARREETAVACMVQHTDLHLPTSLLPRLFERFWLDPEDDDRRPETHDIGLVIAYELVNLHGGNLIADSSPAYGLIFSFALPIRGAN